MLAFCPWTTVKLQLLENILALLLYSQRREPSAYHCSFFFYFAAARRTTHVKREPPRAHWTHRRPAGVDLKRLPAQLNTARSTLRPSLSLWRLSDTISSPETQILEFTVLWTHNLLQKPHPASCSQIAGTCYTIGLPGYANGGAHKHVYLHIDGALITALPSSSTAFAWHPLCDMLLRSRYPGFIGSHVYLMPSPVH